MEDFLLPFLQAGSTADGHSCFFSWSMFRLHIGYRILSWQVISFSTWTCDFLLDPLVADKKSPAVWNGFALQVRCGFGPAAFHRVRLLRLEDWLQRVVPEGSLGFTGNLVSTSLCLRPNLGSFLQANISFFLLKYSWHVIRQLHTLQGVHHEECSHHLSPHKLQNYWLSSPRCTFHPHEFFTF